MKDLHSENYKIKDTDKWKGTLCSWIEELFKCPYYPQMIYRFNAILIKIPMAFFRAIEKTILKFTWNHKISQKAKVLLSKKNKLGGIMLSGFKLYYKAIFN